MIVLLKKEEVFEIIERLKKIEEKFWLDYKCYQKSNREYIEKEFNSLYNNLYELVGNEGKQESFLNED